MNVNTSLVPLKHGFLINGNLTLEPVSVVNRSTTAGVPVAPSTTKKNAADFEEGGAAIFTVNGVGSVNPIPFV